MGGFFLIPRKCLQFFFFLCECLEETFRRPENIIITAIIINHITPCYSPPLTFFSLTGTQPVNAASLRPVNRFSTILKLWTRTSLQHCFVLCTAVIFVLRLLPVWRGFLGLSFPTPLSSRPLPAETALPTNLSVMGLWQMSSARCSCHDFRYSWSQLSILHSCWKLLPTYRDKREKHVPVLEPPTFTLPVNLNCQWKSLCPNLLDCRWDYSFPAEGQGIKLGSGNIQNHGSFVLQCIWATAQTTHTK